MFLKGSRYENAKAFEKAGDGSRFPGVRPRETGGAFGVVEHVVKSGDRLDLLARHYYNDDRLWWRIADANPEFIHGAELLEEDRVGLVILIPQARG